MRTIDHRILIPATPEHVWEVVSDISRNPDWQVECSDVIFLTSKRSGPGLRWRFNGGGHREFVYEVSAWYQGFGYEYYFVDGPHFRDARGRIRLQEVPEGTIVQWTFSYETGGVLGGVRTSLGLHNSIDHTMQDSLRRLWQMLKGDRRTIDEGPSKALMKDAPDVEARTAYQPRHTFKEGTPKPDTETPRARRPGSTAPRSMPVESTPATPHAPPLPAPEPPVMHEDTRPNRAATPDGFVADEGAFVPADFPAEPTFLSDLEEMARFEPPPTSAATQPHTIRITQETSFPAAPAQSTSVANKPDEPASHVVASPQSPAPSAEAPVAELAPPPVGVTTPDAPIAEPPVSSEDTPARPMPAIRRPEPADKAASQTQSSPQEPVHSATPERRSEALASIGDTRSIWEIFNVPRPSEPGETAVVTKPSEPAAEAETTTPVPSAARPVLDSSPAVHYGLAAGTRGLRQSMRRRIVRLRRLG
ncbi:MAG: SRPBCC family protein [Chloroflexi bacterium]|nr:SRPBCC family protein [Chloroflexota bacterium]